MYTPLSPSPHPSTAPRTVSTVSLDPPLDVHTRSIATIAVNSTCLDQGPNNQHLNQRLNQFLNTLIAGVMSAGVISLGVLGTGQTPALAETDLSQSEAEAPLHLVCIKEDQHFICQPDPSSPQDSELLNADRVTATVLPQFLTSAQQEMISNLLIGLAYLLPLGLGLGIFMYDRYMRYRATLLQHHIETLERIWQQNQNLQH